MAGSNSTSLDGVLPERAPEIKECILFVSRRARNRQFVAPKRCSKGRRMSTNLAVLDEPGGPNQGRQSLGQLNVLETTVGLSASLLAQGKQCPVVAINFASCPAPSSSGLVRNLAVIYPDVPFKPWREPVQRFPDSPTFHVWAMGESLPRAPCGMLDLMTNSGMPGQCQR